MTIPAKTAITNKVNVKANNNPNPTMIQIASEIFVPKDIF